MLDKKQQIEMDALALYSLMMYKTREDFEKKLYSISEEDRNDTLEEVKKLIDRRK